MTKAIIAMTTKTSTKVKAERVLEDTSAFAKATADLRDVFGLVCIVYIIASMVIVNPVGAVRPNPREIGAI